MKLLLFNNISLAAQYLCSKLQAALSTSIKHQGHATLILPGGNSIKYFFPYFISLDVLWSKIVIGLSDERCVPIQHSMSNEGQIRENFLKHIDQHRYLSLGKELLDHIKLYPPITVLSMGTDGHVASLFSEELKFWRQQSEGLYHTTKKTPKRISLTEDTLQSSKEIFILLVGEEKQTQILHLKGSPFYHSLLSKATILACGDI